MSTCKNCARGERIVSAAIGYCVDCVRDTGARSVMSLVPEEPVSDHDVRTVNADTKLASLGFIDRHPANCIASWLCPGTTGCGYPKYAVNASGEACRANLAVFMGGCNLECAFCQDWIHQLMQSHRLPGFTLGEIVDWVDERITCLCYCGGEPLLHLPEMIWISQRVKELFPQRIMRFCLETNLIGEPALLRKLARLIQDSGGGFNIGLKAGTDHVHRSLTGRGNAVIWDNLKMLYESFGVGEVLPFLRPSLLLIPGYVDEIEISCVCERLSRLDPKIPLKFVPFFPRHKMSDIPSTSQEHMRLAVEIARSYGIERVSPVESEIEGQIRFVHAREHASE